MPWPKGASTTHLRVWTKEQEDWVKEHYDGNGSSLAEALPFSGAAIRNKAKRLGVTNTKHFHHVVMTVLPEYEPLDLSYIGGFIDGEGSIYQTVNGYRITTANSDEDVIRWMHRVIGIGTVKVNKPRQQQHLPSYVWDIGAQGDVWGFLRAILPYLKIKRLKAETAIAYYGGKWSKP